MCGGGGLGVTTDFATSYDAPPFVQHIHPQLRNTSPSRLAALADALETLGARPDLRFLYNYAQAARVMWTSFNTRDYATLLGAMVHIGTPGLADSRWAADFLAITLCRIS
ncbi:hypothetical protein Vafri_4543 [Volvox africanus]|uniref:Uncharacterized protein n=1 Tax=Volvox africanus TaxID=51714 RepID=A0A8J4AUE6_9CHLO|nr:hypothetical protein Vafri_4543 [Volvox africanus]